MDEPSSPEVPDEDVPLAAGTRLGKYEIVRRLGAGGMGAVYEAIHTEIGKRVAIKTLAPAVAAIPGARQRFLREAQLTSRLRHPHIVDLTDIGSEGLTAYLVMELLAGEDLAHRLTRTGPMPPQELVDLMLPVCSAVGAAHEAGIIHRDLKPQNIFLASGLRGVTPKVLDFGISKSSDTDASSSLTSTGAVIGTPHYLAPEQVQDAHTASSASDQYSIGVIFYRCLTNTNPFEGEGLFSILQAIVISKPVPLAERRVDLPEPLVRVVERAMHSLPWERFESVAALGRALLPFASPKARVIWDDTFAHASDLEPTPRPAAERAANARVDSGTLSPAVVTPTPPRARRGPMVVVSGLLIAAGVVGLFARASRAPSVSALAVTRIAPAPLAAPAPAKPAATPPTREPPAAPIQATKVTPPANGHHTPTKPTRRRSTATRHAVRAIPAAAPRSLNPNGAPVID